MYNNDPSDSGVEPRPFLPRAGACENLRFWDYSARAAGTSGKAGTTTTIEDEDHYDPTGSDDDTESTASESDESPNCVAYESRPPSARRKSAASCSSTSSAPTRKSFGPSPVMDHQSKGTFGRSRGVRPPPSRPYKKASAYNMAAYNNMGQLQEQQDPSSTIDDGPGQHQLAGATRRNDCSTARPRPRSSNIPIQRSRNGKNNNRQQQHGADGHSFDEGLQAHLQQHYAMRTWDMYHRITQSRLHRDNNNNKQTNHKACGVTSSPAKAASIDHCLIHSGYRSTYYCSPSPPGQSSPPEPAMDNMLEQEMLFPLDD
jgi:hypothetical protein